MTPFLDAKLNALVVTQGYYLEDAPAAYPRGKTGYGNREVDNRPPPTPRLNTKSLPRFNTITSFLATISPTKFPSGPDGLLPTRETYY